MDLCDPWTGPSDQEDQDDQDDSQPQSDHDDAATEEWPEPEEQWPDPWQFLGPPREVPMEHMQPLQHPLALAWGDLHSSHNDWPVAIAPARERDQMEVEDDQSMSQRIADQEEEQANWYGAIAVIAANLDCECKTEPPSSEPSEEDPALEEDQDQSEYEDVKEEAIEYQDAKKEPTELSHAKKETKAGKSQSQLYHPAMLPHHHGEQQHGKTTGPMIQQLVPAPATPGQAHNMQKHRAQQQHQPMAHPGSQPVVETNI